MSFYRQIVLPLAGALCLVLCVALPCLASQEQNTVVGSAQTWSRFHRTVLSLREDSPEARADFAVTALGELTEAFIAEADLARREAQKPDPDVKLGGWSRAVDQYANQLMLVLDDVDLGFPVLLSIRHKESVAITVADRTVILSHPRSNQQTTFEQRVLIDFCTRQDCKLLTASIADTQAIPLSASQVRPDWIFSEDGPICSYQSINLRFASAKNLPRFRGICEQLLEEMLTLAAEIAWQRRHGVVVDWDGLSIRSTPQRPEHLVLLNRAGDSLLVTIPLIYGTPELLGHIKPWMRGRVTDEKSGNVDLVAARYGWEHSDK